jgi:molybdopterin converting factor small subunit
MNRSDTDAGMIEVRVRLFADLRRYLPDGVNGPFCCRLPAGATVESVLRQIGIAPGQQITAGLNGRLAQRTTAVADGDALDLFSPMEGG